MSEELKQAVDRALALARSEHVVWHVFTRPIEVHVLSVIPPANGVPYFAAHPDGTLMLHNWPGMPGPFAVVIEEEPEEDDDFDFSGMTMEVRDLHTDAVLYP